MEEFAAEVTLGRPGAAMSFGRPVFDESHYVAIPFRVQASGVDGRPAVGIDVRTSIELEGWGRWLQGLLGYVDDLARSWRGWADERAWSDDGRNVELRATHDGLGTVQFIVEVRHGGPEAWRARALIECDPGTLSAFADAMGSMLRAAPWPFDHPLPSA